MGPGPQWHSNFVMSVWWTCNAHRLHLWQRMDVHRQWSGEWCTEQTRHIYVHIKKELYGATNVTNKTHTIIKRASSNIIRQGTDRQEHKAT